MYAVLQFVALFILALTKPVRSLNIMRRIERHERKLARREAMTPTH